MDGREESKQRATAASCTHRAGGGDCRGAERIRGRGSKRRNVDVDVHVRAALPRLSGPLAFSRWASLSHTLSPLPFLLLPPVVSSQACPPSSLSLATRCRRTRDLHGAEPPKTITKCQGCHCAHVREPRRASIAPTHTVTPSPRFPLPPPLRASARSSLTASTPPLPVAADAAAAVAAAAVPLSQQWHWEKLRYPQLISR